MVSDLTPMRTLELWRRVLISHLLVAGGDLTARQLALLLTVYMTAAPRTVRGLAEFLGLRHISASMASSALSPRTGIGGGSVVASEEPPAPAAIATPLVAVVELPNGVLERRAPMDPTVRVTAGPLRGRSRRAMWTAIASLAAILLGLAALRGSGGSAPAAASATSASSARPVASVPARRMIRSWR